MVATVPAKKKPPPCKYGGGGGSPSLQGIKNISNVKERKKDDLPGRETRPTYVTTHKPYCCQKNKEKMSGLEPFVVAKPEVVVSCYVDCIKKETYTSGANSTSCLLD